MPPQALAEAAVKYNSSQQQPERLLPPFFYMVINDDFYVNIALLALLRYGFTARYRGQRVNIPRGVLF